MLEYIPYMDPMGYNNTLWYIYILYILYIALRFINYVRYASDIYVKAIQFCAKDNKVTIDGGTNLAFSEDTAQIFAAKVRPTKSSCGNSTKKIWNFKF